MTAWHPFISKQTASNLFSYLLCSAQVLVFSWFLNYNPSLAAHYPSHATVNVAPKQCWQRMIHFVIGRSITNLKMTRWRGSRLRSYASMCSVNLGWWMCVQACHGSCSAEWFMPRLCDESSGGCAPVEQAWLIWVVLAWIVGTVSERVLQLEKVEKVMKYMGEKKTSRVIEHYSHPHNHYHK